MGNSKYMVPKPPVELMRFHAAVSLFSRDAYQKINDCFYRYLFRKKGNSRFWTYPFLYLGMCQIVSEIYDYGLKDEANELVGEDAKKWSDWITSEAFKLLPLIHRRIFIWKVMN